MTFQHYCKYSLIRNSMTTTPFGKQYGERCKCGRTILIDWHWNYNHSQDKIKWKSAIVKHWFDSNGVLERITGMPSEWETKLSNGNESHENGSGLENHSSKDELSKGQIQNLDSETGNID